MVKQNNVKMSHKKYKNILDIILLSMSRLGVIEQNMVLEDPFERFFYETECIKCNWSVRGG
jgi:hypothetical protein